MKNKISTRKSITELEFNGNRPLTGGLYRLQRHHAGSNASSYRLREGR
jgi:hypothetical protein